MTEPLFPKDIELFNFIRSEIEAKHFAPTLIEMTEQMGIKPISLQTIVTRLRRLEANDLIERVPGRERGIVITGHLDGIGFSA
tara:strand:+ start:9960 stop:10208 length:249 start_codon:yes stop_codon:yes gene_type:complete